MRTFIALPLPEKIKDYLCGLQDRLKKTGADVKWVNPKNIHLTLKFLGEINPEQTKELEVFFEKIAAGVSAYTISIGGIGAFPKIQSPRTIWVGIEKGKEETRDLASRLEEKVSTIGIPKEERPYSCHLTIGRTKSSLNRSKLIQGLNDLLKDPISSLEFPVNRIILFKSTLTPGGPIYEVLKEANLKNS